MLKKFQGGIFNKAINICVHLRLSLLGTAIIIKVEFIEATKDSKFLDNVEFAENNAMLRHRLQHMLLKDKYIY